MGTHETQLLFKGWGHRYGGMMMTRTSALTILSFLILACQDDQAQRDDSPMANAQDMGVTEAMDQSFTSDVTEASDAERHEENPRVDSGSVDADVESLEEVDAETRIEAQDSMPVEAPVEPVCPPPELDCGEIDVHDANATNRYPIVFVHGMGGFENLGPWDYFYGIPALLSENGYGVHITVTDPFNSSIIRTDQLAPQIDRILDCTCRPKINIIAHSQGGIDARLLISDRGYADRIASLTTISSPHRGTRVADVLLGLTDGPIDGLVDGLADAFTGVVWGESQEDPNLRIAMASCSTEAMAEFNVLYPNDPAVSYFSYAGFSGRLANGRPECEGSELDIPRHGDTVAPEFLASFLFLGGITRANDGLVEVESARWGRFRGCLPADHLDEIGQLGGVVDEFDYRRFYRRHAEFLADEGF